MFFDFHAVKKSNDTLKLKVHIKNRKGKIDYYIISQGIIVNDDITRKKITITPEKYSHLTIYDTIKGTQKFKSVDRIGVDGKKPKYVFMNYIKEYSSSEYISGKINVYGHKYRGTNNYNEQIITIYLEDKTGFHSMLGKKKRVHYLGKEGNTMYKSLKNKHKVAFFTNNAKLREVEKKK